MIKNKIVFTFEDKLTHDAFLYNFTELFREVNKTIKEEGGLTGDNGDKLSLAKVKKTKVKKYTVFNFINNE